MSDDKFICIYIYVFEKEAHPNKKNYILLLLLLFFGLIRERFLSTYNYYKSSRLKTPHSDGFAKWHGCATKILLMVKVFN